MFGGIYFGESYFGGFGQIILRTVEYTVTNHPAIQFAIEDMPALELAITNYPAVRLPITEE